MHSRTLSPALRALRVALALGCSFVTLCPAAEPANAGDRAAVRKLLTGAETGKLTRAQCLDCLEKLVAAGTEEISRPGADPSDITDKLSGIGVSTDAIFAFVRDKIRTEPYAGKLRGASGTLLAESGNALDKSLLLAALLRASNRECRLVQGTLSEESSAKLVSNFLALDPLGGILGRYRKAQMQDEPLARVAARCGFDQKALDALFAGLQRDADKLDQVMSTRTDQHATFVLDQLGKAKIRLGQSAETWRQQLGSAQSSHVWVQVKVSSDPEKWLDLDPSFSGARPGQVFAADSAPFEESTDQQHSLQFTLTYKRKVNGEIDEKTLLEVVLPAANGLLNHSVFSIDPADPLPAMAEISPENTTEFAAALRGMKHFRAHFRSGTETTRSETFDLAGFVGEAAAASPQGMGASMGGLGFGGGEPEKQEATFLELYVTLAFHGPGVQRPSQRRVLLTADQLKNSCGSSPLLEWKLLLQPGVLSPTLADFGSLRHTLAGVTPALAVLRGGRVGGTEYQQLSQPVNDVYAQLPVLLSQSRQYALARVLAEHPDVTAAFLTPQLVIAEHRTCLCPESNTCGQARIDIVENGITFIPRTDGADQTAAALALRQGVFDTVAEALLLANVEKVESVQSPLDSFEAVRTNGGALQVFTRDAELIPLNSADREWIKACESDNRLILVSAKANAVNRHDAAWWSLDPTTGTILGRAHGGGGQAAVEKAETESEVAFGGLKCFGSASATYAKAAVKSKGHPSDKDGWEFGIATLSCVVDMTVGFARPTLLNNKRVAQAVDYLIPQVIDALSALGPE